MIIKNGRFSIGGSNSLIKRNDYDRIFSPYAYYPLNSNGGDLSGNGNNLTFSGGAPIFSSGFNSGCLSSGIGAYTSNSGSLGKSFSLSVWLRTTYSSFPDNSACASVKLQRNTTDVCSISLDTNDKGLDVFNIGNISGSSPVLVSLSRSSGGHHFVVASDASGALDFYLDGDRVSRQTISQPSEIVLPKIIIDTGFGSGFNSHISHCFLYDFMIYQEEVSLLYNRGQGISFVKDLKYTKRV